MSITHAKVSAKADGADTSLVLPSDWNDDHVVSLTAADVAIVDSGALITATDVEGALQELAGASASAHIADAGDAHDASAISVADAGGLLTATDVEAALAEIAGEVDTNTAGLAAHIGDSADAHDASAISILDAANDFTATDVEGALAELQADAETHAAAADPHAGYVLESLFDAKGDIIAASADNTPAKLTVGANDTILMADSTAGTGLKWVASASPSAVGTAAATGTADTFTRGDHVHAHEAAHINHDTTWAAKGDIIAGTANDTAAVLTAGANDTILMADSGQSTGLKWVASQTPSTQAFGDAAAEGTADTFARGDHKHAMPVLQRTIEVLVTDPNGDALTTGDGKAHLFIPALLNGQNLVAAHAAVTTVSSSGLPTIQIHNVTQAADMLSTRITIDASEKTSYTAAAAPVIDTGNDDVATGDELRVDVDVAGTGTKGLIVMLTFQAP